MLIRLFKVVQKKVVQDADLYNFRTQGLSAGKWEHFRACPCCLSEIDHQEFMTDICLSCGGTFDSLTVKSGAKRRVIANGRPDIQMRIGNLTILKSAIPKYVDDHYDNLRKIVRL